MMYLTFFQVRIVRIATRPIRLGNADNKRLSQLAKLYCIKLRVPRTNRKNHARVQQGRSPGP